MFPFGLGPGCDDDGESQRDKVFQLLPGGRAAYHYRYATLLIRRQVCETGRKTRCTQEMRLGFRCLTLTIELSPRFAFWDNNSNAGGPRFPCRFCVTNKRCATDVVLPCHNSWVRCLLWPGAATTCVIMIHMHKSPISSLRDVMQKKKGPPADSLESEIVKLQYTKGPPVPSHSRTFLFLGQLFNPRPLMFSSDGWDCEKHGSCISRV